MTNIFILASILFFTGKAETKEERSTTKFYHLPLEKLCTEFSAVVRPVNIMLKNDAKKPDYRILSLARAFSHSMQHSIHLISRYNS